jgi:hypothetical protein
MIQLRLAHRRLRAVSGDGVVRLEETVLTSAGSAELAFSDA